MATRAEIRKRLGIVTLEDPAVANKELSEIHGCSYGVDCKYIGKAKGEYMSRYENRKIMDF